MVNLTSSCDLTLKPKFAVNAQVSLLNAARGSDGKAAVPLASDSAPEVSYAVNNVVGYYYLEPRRCPQLYTLRIKGSRLLATDLATAIRRGLGVSNSVLSTVTILDHGLKITWQTAGPKPQDLAYTSIRKVGGPTAPDFAPFKGTTSKYCSLLDINPTPDLDSKPMDGVIDASTTSLVGRVPRPIPGRKGYFACAIAPAGGYVRVRRGSVRLADAGALQPYVSEEPNEYVPCGAGGYLYRLGAINAAGDPHTDSCQQCPRGSYATSSASLCAACPANNFQDKPGQRSCKPCEFGYAPFPGALRCMACYYGRAYCSEGYSANELAYTCNSARLPEGYSPENGFSVVRPLEDPTDGAAAERYSPTFKNCHVKGAGQTLVGFNVSAECRVQVYVMGDLGKGPDGCSQNAATNAITAYYAAPNILSGMRSKGLKEWRVGILGNLDQDGMLTKVFATSAGARVPSELAVPTQFKLVLPETGWSYLGGGDNGQGLNAVVKGVKTDPCPAGTVKEMLNGDGVKDPGEDPNKLLSDYCVPCGVGTFCPANENVGGPQNCPAGTFGPTIGAKSQEGCANCPVGTHQDADGAYTCRTCPPNTFAPAAGATTCTSCGDGYEVSAQGANFCNPCSAGTYRDSATSESCQECPAGTSSKEAAGQCTVCEPGTYSSSPKSPSCTECPRGSFQRSYGQKKCELCPVGTYGDSRGRSQCKVCPVGTFNPNCGSVSSTACQRCPPGKAAPQPGSGSCLPCGVGYFSEKGGASSCKACPTGTYSKAIGSKGCFLCPKGTYTDGGASKQCTPCPIGFYAPTSGAARCMSCPAGAFTEAAGAWKCERCKAGTYSTRSAASSDVTCTACPPGSYSFTDGATQCMLCPEGQFAAGGGSTSCDVCPLGTYSSSAGSQRCLPCKGGYTTQSMGATSVRECSVKIKLNG